MIVFLIISGTVYLLLLAINEGLRLRGKDNSTPLSGKEAEVKKVDGWIHKLTTLLRLMVVLFVLVPIYMIKGLDIHILAPLTGLYISLAWTGWNTILNLIRGLDWWYKGSVASGTSSVLDKLLSNIYVYWGLQILVVVGTIGALIFIK